MGQQHAQRKHWNVEKYREFSLLRVLPTRHQSPREQLEHVGEDQLQGGMSSWISGEFGEWINIFPAEFGRMEWEGTRLLEQYCCTCPTSPSSLSRHQSFQERSPCSEPFHRGRQGFSSLFLTRNPLCCWGFHMCQFVQSPVKEAQSHLHHARISTKPLLGKGKEMGWGAEISSPKITLREISAAEQNNHISCQGAQAFWQVGDGSQELTRLSAVYS